MQRRLVKCPRSVGRRGMHRLDALQGYYWDFPMCGRLSDDAPLSVCRWPMIVGIPEL